MRRRAAVWSVLSSGAVLAVGWQLGSQATETQVASATALPGTTSSTPKTTTPATTAPTPTPTSSSATSSSGVTPTTAPATSAPAATAAPAAPAAGASGTFTGTSVSTRYGNVQVQVVVSNGSITDVVALALTADDRKSVSISNRAAPVLRSEVLSAQSASVQGVSGATYTSDAYLQSLQSALDQAGL